MFLNKNTTKLFPSSLFVFYTIPRIFQYISMLLFINDKDNDKDQVIKIKTIILKHYV